MVIRKTFQLNIGHGPSKMDLLMSFATAYAKAPNQPFMVVFEIQPGQETPQGIVTGIYKYSAIITELAHEDISGESFNLGGILHDDFNGKLKIVMERNFTGYFNTRTREGYIEFTTNFTDNK